MSAASLVLASTILDPPDRAAVAGFLSGKKRGQVVDFVSGGKVDKLVLTEVRHPRRP